MQQTDVCSYGDEVSERKWETDKNAMVTERKFIYESCHFLNRYFAIVKSNNFSEI